MKPEIDFLAEYDEAAILEELRRVASITGSDTVTKSDLKRLGRMNPSTVVRRFGSLRRALQLAGLTSRRFMKPTDQELLGMLVNLWQQVLEREGRTPQQDDLKAYNFPISSDTFTRRFGGWRKALIRAHDSITLESISDEPAPSVFRAPEPTPQRKRKSISVRKRFFVMKRDHFACVRCGASGVGVRLEVHHRFPFARGGSDDLINLETLCYECNRGQSDDVV